MIDFFNNFIDKLTNNYLYNLSSELANLWRILIASVIILLITSLIIFFYKKVVFFTLKIREIKIKRVFKVYSSNAKSIYVKYIPKLSYVLSNRRKSPNIGGLVALLQTNWQFKRKNDDEEIVYREPEELGFRQIFEGDTLVQLAIAGKLGIEDITLNTEDASKNEYYVSFTVINLTSERITAKIPKGQIFENKRENTITQNLVIDNDYEISINGKSSGRFDIPALCLNKSLKPPEGTSGNITIFEVINKNYNSQDELWNLIEFFNKSIKSEGFFNGYQPDIAKGIINACGILQGNSLDIKPDENSRNGYISAILSAKGFIVKDQSRWGKSEVGKTLGEIDIKIEDSEGNATSICEGLILKANTKSIIDSHVTKIFGYDANGVPRNFIIVYAEAKKFSQLWGKYLQYVNTIEFEHKLSNEIVDISEKMSPFTEIKVGLGYHNRSEGIIELYHVFVNLN